MHAKQPDANVSITGGSTVAGNIGGSANTGSIEGTINIGAADDKLAGLIDQLRAELAELRSNLTAGGTDAEPSDVDDVTDALNGPRPDLARADNRWTRLLRRIPEPLRNLDTVTRIVQLFGDIRNLTT